MMILVLVAEAATLAFFLIFGWFAAGRLRESRSLPQPKPDTVGDAFCRAGPPSDDDWLCRVLRAHRLLDLVGRSPWPVSL
jgi:hypothetical protein